MNYSKGEWVRDGYNIEVQGTHRGICTTGLYHDDKPDTRRENVANSLLISAAPDMYEALKKFEMAISNFDILAKGLPAQIEMGSAIELAKKAIAKAEGK
jgi:hypothetical protein